MVALPVPLVADSIVIHEFALATVHVQPLLVVTLTVLVATPYPWLRLTGDNTYVHAVPAWLTVKLTVLLAPVTVITPERGPVVLAVTAKVTVPLLLPLADEVRFIQPLVLFTAQVHPPALVTSNELFEAVLAKFTLPGFTATVH